MNKINDTKVESRIEDSDCTKESLIEVKVKNEEYKGYILVTIV